MFTSCFAFVLTDLEELFWMVDFFILLPFFVGWVFLFKVYRIRENVYLKRITLVFAILMLVYGINHLLQFINYFWELPFSMNISKVVAGLVGGISLIVLFKNLSHYLKKPTPVSLKEEKIKHGETQRQLKKSAKRFHLIMKFAPIAMGLIDLKGKWFDVNRAFVKMIGYSEEDLLKMTFRELNHPEDIDKGAKKLRLAREGKLNVCKFEKRYIHKNGKTIWVKISIVPIRNSKNKTEYFIAQINDITETKESEQKIRNLNKSLEEKVEKRTQELQTINEDLENFVYTVTHDLRLPLKTLTGLSQVLKEEMPKEVDEDILKTVGYIENSVQKLDQVILDLLAFSKAGRENLNIVSLDMEQMMQETYEEIKVEYMNKDIVFTKKEMPIAYGDETAIRQICQNLLSNALKYASKKEKIIVEVMGWEEGNKNIYCVKDNGAGFNEKGGHKLFGLFQRLHNNSEFEGTGLGLSVCKKIMKKHGGDIWAKGEVGKGASFFFSLPKSN